MSSSSTNNDSTNNQDAIKNNNNNNTKSANKNINVAFIVSYVGTPFKGSQIQNHHHPMTTVEGLLLVALDKVGLINAEVLKRYEKVKQLRKNNKNYNPATSFRAVPQNLALGRTSRTDRGVSALSNVFNMYCSEKVFKSFESNDKMLDEINKAVVELTAEYFEDTEIKAVDASSNETKEQLAASRPLLMVQGVQEVPTNFLGRYCANRRVYRYLIPAFALDPPRSKMLAPLPGSWTFTKTQTSQECSEDNNNHTQQEDSLLSFSRIFTSEDEKRSSMAVSTTFSSSITEEEFLASSAKEAADHFASRAAKANEVLQKFTGYHRFHNYTGKEIKSTSRMETNVLSESTLHASDTEALRKIIRAEILPVPLMIRESTNNSNNNDSSSSTRYLPHYMFQIDGGSFLLHMIRKIVGTTIAIVRGARDELIDMSLSPEKLVNTPMAPARYLSQTRVFFESYEQFQTFRFNERKLPLLCKTIDKANERMDKYENERIFAEMVHLDATGKSVHLSCPPDEVMDPHNYETKEAKDLLARQKKNQQQKTAVDTTSEMKRFVRMCPLHNWNVQENPEKYRPKAKKTEEEIAEDRKKRLERKQAAVGENGNENENESQHQHNDSRRRQRPREDDDDDNNENENEFDGESDEDEDDSDKKPSSSAEDAAASSTTGVEFHAKKKEKKPTTWDQKSAWLTIEEISRRNATM